MARAKRAMPKRRQALDWVVNEETYGQLAGGTIPVGGLGMFPLTYPKFLVEEQLGPAGPFIRSAAAFPEQRKGQTVKAVRGHVTLQTDTWAVGGRMHWIFRIVKKPIDFSTLGAIVDGIYALEDPQFANERFVWQEIVYDAFVAGTTTRSLLRVNCKCNVRLEPDEALFFAVENNNVGSFPSNTRIDQQMYLRTLMVAD